MSIHNECSTCTCIFQYNFHIQVYKNNLLCNTSKSAVYMYFRHSPLIPFLLHHTSRTNTTITTLFYPYPLTQKVVCSPVQHLRVQQCVELSHDVDNYLSGSPQIVLVLVQIWQPVILIQPPGILHRNPSWRKLQSRIGSKKTYRCMHCE